MSATRRYPTGISQRTGESIDRNLDLIRGYTSAQLEDVDNTEQVPGGAITVLLLDDDPVWFERNMAIVVNGLWSGNNVYARHVTKEGRPK